MTHDDAPLDIKHDVASDIVTICGVRYTGHLFRDLGFASPGTWLRIEARADGALSVYSVVPETERAFDMIVGKGAVAGA